MPSGHFIPDEYTLSSRWVNTNGAGFTLGEYDLVVMAFEECGRTRVHRVRTQGTLI